MRRCGCTSRLCNVCWPSTPRSWRQPPHDAATNQRHDASTAPGDDCNRSQQHIDGIDSQQRCPQGRLAHDTSLHSTPGGTTLLAAKGECWRGWSRVWCVLDPASLACALTLRLVVRPGCSSSSSSSGSIRGSGSGSVDGLWRRQRWPRAGGDDITSPALVTLGRRAAVTAWQGWEAGAQHGGRQGRTPVHHPTTRPACIPVMRWCGRGRL